MGSLPIFRIRYLISLALSFLLLGLIARPALADGIIIPDPPPQPGPISLEDSWLTIRYHRVSVSIEDQVAVTRVDQEFVNEHDWEVEGTYIFPIPQGASISRFVIWVDGEPMEGKILPAEQARKIYEDIVRERRDPALLEYIDQDAVQVRIYPIPAGGSQRIELEYSQVLEAENGMVRYLYPLNTEKFSAKPLEHCSVHVEVVSSQPLRSIYSPTHQDRIFVQREGEKRAVVAYEQDDVLPDQDFELIYSFGREGIGLNLLVYPDLEGDRGSGREGYFLLMASPGIKEEEIIPRDIVLVLDTSGSMEGEKLAQAKEAAVYVLGKLNPDDRFNVIAFSTGVSQFASQLQPRDQVAEAVTWIGRREALGGTNINLALLEAVSFRNPTEDSNSARPLVLLFLTDGLPTEGVTDIGQILANIQANSTSYLRLFAFGVGDDVNTELLDSLAGENGGQVSYVRPGERIDEEVSGLYARIKAPVLTDLELSVQGVMVEEIYPPQLPDLYSGGQIILAGRYRLPAASSGQVEIELSGRVNEKIKTYTYQADFSGDKNLPGETSYIPRLWAARKIGYLLNQIRYQGENQEWVDAIIQLSLRYGIITPYTSFLVEEHDILAGEGWDAAAEELMQSYSGPAVGAEAVDKAEAELNLRSAESIPQAGQLLGTGASPSLQPQLEYVGDKTFLFQNGIWVDTQYDPEAMDAVKIGFGTESYYQLTSLQPSWGKYLALGEQVIFVVDGKAYQITLEGEGISQLPEEIYTSGGEGPGKVEPAPGTNSICSAPLALGLAAARWVLRKTL
jgi:Ca-activated chloride channel family protein